MKNITKALIGLVAWVGFVGWLRATPASVNWILVLLAFAPLVLVPLALDLVVEKRDLGRIGASMQWALRLQLPAAVLLAFSCGLGRGIGALLLAAPWAIVTVLLATAGVGRMLRDGWSRPIDRLSVDAGLGYLLIGGLWALADRAGVRPLRFDPSVVALTAVHFHYAGFLLPLLAGQVAREQPDSRFAARGIVGVVLGVPVVAAGITISQLGGSPAIEAAAGCALALAGAAIAVLHIRYAIDAAGESLPARLLLGAAGASLFFAMTLSAVYAARNVVFVAPWLGLPQMAAMHGTLNGFGVGLCGLLGWRSVRRTS
jgi:hypothetical protein